MFSGIKQSINEDGIIPASQRPDGTWRKARRVKDGYVPQEEVPLYESKGKQVMNQNTKPDGPVILAGGEVGRRVIPGLVVIDNEDKAKTKKKVVTIEKVTQKLANVDISAAKKVKGGGTNTPTTPTSSIDPSKKLKNLKKKIREIDAIEEKLKEGLVLEPDQLAKIKRKNDLLIDIRKLEKEMENVNRNL